ncbi:hypothetical protein ACFP81_08180 [Deinococcus lacus]|uniref:Uncharacterized protein n=1 Tax=Deinococcus lacus TaxID=392561 RepID=A0ABW1YEX1_9DEIO
MTDKNDTGNGMSDRSAWTTDDSLGDERTVSEGGPVDAGTALGGNPDRFSDAAPMGVPSTDAPGGVGGTGTSFGVDPADDKTL